MVSSTPTRITRPSVRQPDSYHIAVDETMLLWLEEGILARAGRLHLDIMAHADCNMHDETGCRVRESWLVKEYGSVEAAEAEGARLTDCSEDLMFLHRSLGELMDFVTQSRYLRNRPGARGYHDTNDAETQLMAIKGEAAYRQEQGSVPTGQMPKLTDEILADLTVELDGKTPNGGKANSLLGLDASVKPLRKPSNGKAIKDNPQA